MNKERFAEGITRRAHPGWLVALIIFVAVGCGGQKTVATNDPNSPLYHAQGVDFRSYDTAIIDMSDVTTNNNEGVDEVKATAQQSLETWLKQSGIFRSVKDTSDSVGGKAVVIKARISVNWGSRAARALVGMGAGRATININYNVFDKQTNKLIAKMDVSDSMSGPGWDGWAGGGAKRLVYSGTENLRSSRRQIHTSNLR